MVSMFLINPLKLSTSPLPLAAPQAAWSAAAAYMAQQNHNYIMCGECAPHASIL